MHQDMHVLYMNHENMHVFLHLVPTSPPPHDFVVEKGTPFKFL